MVGQSMKMKKGLVPAPNELKKSCRWALSCTQLWWQDTGAEGEEQGGRMIGYRLLIIKESGKAYGRIGLWRKGKIRIFVEEKLQKTWANTWIQESRMWVVKKTGYPQYHHHILQFVTIFTDFAKGRMILVFMWSESLNSAHLFELTTHSWVGLTQVLILRISLQTGDRGKDLDFLATHNLGGLSFASLFSCCKWMVTWWCRGKESSGENQ